MSSLSRAASPKKSGSPTPGSSQLPIAPQLEVELSDLPSLVCVVTANAS